MTQLGGQLAIPDQTNVGKEDLIAQDPEVIFVVYMANDREDTEQSILVKVEGSRFSELQTVREGRQGGRAAALSLTLKVQYWKTVPCICLKQVI